MKEALLSVQSHPSKIIEEYKNQVLFLVRVIRNGHEFLLFHLMHGHGTMCTGDMSWSSFGSNSVSIFFPCATSFVNLDDIELFHSRFCVIQIPT